MWGVLLGEAEVALSDTTDFFELRKPARMMENKPHGRHTSFGEVEGEVTQRK